MSGLPEEPALPTHLPLACLIIGSLEQEYDYGVLERVLDMQSQNSISVSNEFGRTNRK